MSAERHLAFTVDLERRGIERDTVAARITADVSRSPLRGRDDR